MRALLRTGIFGVLAAVVAASQPVGTVSQVAGRWCRGGREVLTAGKSIAARDRVRYCASSLETSDSITIRFRNRFPRDRTFRCETPGVCSAGAMLYLGLPREIPGTRLISRNTRARTGSGATSDNVLVALPDVLIASAEVRWSELAARHPGLVICRLRSGSLSNCEPAAKKKSAVAGLHAIVAPAAGVAGLALVANDTATARARWLTPPRYGAVTTVVQRENILDLYGSGPAAADSRRF